MQKINAKYILTIWWISNGRKNKKQKKKQQQQQQQKTKQTINLAQFQKYFP